MLGWLMFSFYMRLVLTPVALLTWANLNHTLCGTEGDPVWLLLDLGKWYYPAAEIYLGASAAAFIIINFAIAYFCKRVVWADSSCSHGIYGSTPTTSPQAKKIN